MGFSFFREWSPATAIVVVLATLWTFSSLLVVRGFVLVPRDHCYRSTVSGGRTTTTTTTTTTPSNPMVYSNTALFWINSNDKDDDDNNEFESYNVSVPLLDQENRDIKKSKVAGEETMNMPVITSTTKTAATKESSKQQQQQNYDDSFVKKAFEEAAEEIRGQGFTFGGAVNENDDHAPFDEDCFPGRDENDRYECHPSVKFWRDFRNPLPSPEQDEEATRDNLRDMAAVASKFARAGPAASAYFGRHLGRTAYFMANAALGDAAFGWVKQLNGGGEDPEQTRQKADNNRSTQSSSGDGASATASNKPGAIPLLNQNRTIFASDRPKGPFQLPMGMSSSIASRLVLESILCYEQDYFECIQAGQYREPWDTTTPNHRQSNPLFVLQQTSRFVREAVGTMGRRSRGTPKDKEVPFFRKEVAASANAGGENNTTAATMSKKKTNLYPDYYQTAFHYQGDGWMSKDSADVYETSCETLFLGRQDAMQRTTLPPLVDFAKKRFGLKTSASSPPQRSNKRPMRVLEVACGTGRFLTYVRDNLPLNAEVTAVDLSPFYLEKAAENDEYWRRTRLARERRLWGPRGGPIKIPEATLVQARAEELPFGDGAFDAVVCVYLCHEIPRHIRAKAAAEMARVVAPGGIVVLTDSVQKGDRPALDDYITNFSKMNEPFYKDFANDDLGRHFEKAGLVPKTKRVRSNTKSLSFAKPEKNDDDVPSL